MAEDTVSLMDAVGFEKAYIFGLSMGGMIAQEIAINFQDRVMGCILCVTHCGGSKQIQPTKEVLKMLMTMIHEQADACNHAILDFLKKCI